jgi:hypothetical protein
MKYPNEEVEDVSLLQCWDSLVKKQFMKSHDQLKIVLDPSVISKWILKRLGFPAIVVDCS